MKLRSLFRIFYQIMIIILPVLLFSQSLDRFELIDSNGEKVVLDHKTNQMWQQSGSPTKLIFADNSIRDVENYVKYLNQSNYAGFSDWRLPTRRELESLITDENYNGLYFSPLFNKKQFHIWSSEVEIKQQADWTPKWIVWKVYFDQPKSFQATCTAYGFVKAIRNN